MFSPSRYQSIYYSQFNAAISAAPSPIRAPHRTVPWRCSVTLIWVVLAWIEPLSVQWSRRVGKLLDRDSDSTPDSRPSVIRTHGPQGRRPTEHRCIREPQGLEAGAPSEPQSKLIP